MNWIKLTEATTPPRPTWLNLDQFMRKRRFPPPDPSTGNYDLKAIDAWQDARSLQFFGTAVKDGASLTRERLRMIEAAK